MANRKIIVDIKAKADKTEAEDMSRAIDKIKTNIESLEHKKIDLQMGSNKTKISEINTEIEQCKSKIQSLSATPFDARVNANEINELINRINTLDQKRINLELDVEKQELNDVQAKMEQLRQEEIEVQLRNQSAMEALDQIGQGFDRLKQGANELKDSMGTILESAGKQETNFSFLEHALNNDTELAKSKMGEIQEIVTKLPGDDTAVQGLLSQAIAKDASLANDTLSDIGVAYADYASAMSYYGKSGIEAQQDMTNYILAGNTAELERSPILASHIDKLKEANTVQERTKALQDALNAENWGGMSQVDTYANKLETFNGMLERGKYTLGGYFQEGAKGAMDFALKLDDATGGMVGVVLATASFATPLTDTVMGLGQMAMGFNALKDVAGLAGLKEKLGAVKTSVMNLASTIKTNLITAFTSLKTTMTGTVIPALKNVGTWLVNAGRSALTAGLNALKSAGMWLIQKGQMVASAVASGLVTIKNWALAVSEWAVASPILVVILVIGALIAILAYLYFNNEQVRNSINGLGQAFMMVGQIMYTSIVNAINWIITSLQGLWTYIMTLGGLLPQQVNITGNQIIDSIIAVLLFLMTLPLQIGMIFINIIARTLGFGNNFAQKMLSAGSRAVSNFINYISQIPSKLGAELGNALNKVNEWASTLPQKFWEAGVNAVKNFLNALGIHSPGTMQRMLVWEISEMARRTPVESKKLLNNISDMGTNIVDEFGEPELRTKFTGLEFGNADLNNNNGNVIGGKNGDTIINVYGDVDSEKRIQQIVDAVTRELSWDNETAGRVV